MARKVIGITLKADTKQFVRAMHNAVRSFASVEYIAGRAAARFSGIMSKIFQGVGFIAGGALLAGMAGALATQRLTNALFKPAIEAASEFNKEFYRTAFLAKVDPGTPLSEELKKAAIKAALGSRFSASDTMKGLGNLMTTGLSANDAKKFLPNLLDFAEASFGELDLATAAKIMGISAKKFDFKGMDPEEKSKKIADSILALRQSSRLEFGEILGMIDSMNNAARQMGLTMDESFGIISAIQQQGLSPRRSGRWISSMGNSLDVFKTVITEVEGLDPGRFGNRIKSAAKFMDYTDDSFRKSTGEMMNGLEIFAKIDRDMRKLSGPKYKETQKSVLGALFARQETRQAFEMIQALEIVNEETGEVLNGFDALNKQIALFNNSSGLAAKGAELNRKSFQGLMEIISGVVDTFYMLIGLPIIESLYPVANIIKDIATGITEIVQNNPELARFASIVMIVGGSLLSIASISMAVLASLGLLTIFIGGSLLVGLIYLIRTVAIAVSRLRSMAKVLKLNRNRADKFKSSLSRVGDELKRNSILTKQWYQHLSNLTDANKTFSGKTNSFIQLILLFGKEGLLAGLSLLSGSLVTLGLGLIALISVLMVFGSVIAFISASVINLGLVLPIYFIKKIYDAKDSLGSFTDKLKHSKLFIESFFNLIQDKGVKLEDKLSLEKVGLWDWLVKGKAIFYRIKAMFTSMFDSIDTGPLDRLFEPFKDAFDGLFGKNGLDRTSVKSWEDLGNTIARGLNVAIEAGSVSLYIFGDLFYQLFDFIKSNKNELRMLAMLFGFVTLYMASFGMYIVWTTNKLIELFNWITKLKNIGANWLGEKVVGLFGGNTDAIRAIMGISPSMHGILGHTDSNKLSESVEPGSVRPAGTDKNMFLPDGTSVTPEQQNKRYEEHQYKTKEIEKAVRPDLTININNPQVRDEFDLAKMGEIVSNAIEKYMQDNRLIGA